MKKRPWPLSINPLKSARAGRTGWSAWYVQRFAVEHRCETRSGGRRECDRRGRRAYTGKGRLGSLRLARSNQRSGLLSLLLLHARDLVPVVLGEAGVLLEGATAGVFQAVDAPVHALEPIVDVVV